MYSRAFERQATIMARSTKWSDIGHSNARKKAPLWHTAYEVIFMAVSHRGAISFGLVHIPVGLYTATQDNDIHFNQLCKDDHSRVRYKISIHAPARGATANTANRLPVFTPLLQHILQDFTSIRHIQNAETAKKSKNQVRNSWQFHVRSRFAPVLK